LRPVSPTVTRRVAATVSLSVLLVGVLVALNISSGGSTPAPKPHPVPPKIHKLQLAGVDPAALAELRRHDPDANPRVLTQARATELFKLLGVSWIPTEKVPDIEVQVRTRGDKGWSSWSVLELEDVSAAPRGALDPSDDTAATRASSEPTYSGPSSGVQVRIDLLSGTLPSDLRVDLVEPGTSDADSTITAQATASATTLADGSASAGAWSPTVTQPAIITRAQWGADESLRGDFAGYGQTIKAAFVHHTTGASDYSSADVPAMIRAIYAFHTQTNGWSDIGYNFLVDRFGRLFEGRWGGMDQPVIGAHTGGFNTDTVGVAALGDYDLNAVPSAVVAAFGRIIGWKLGLYGRDPYGRTTLTSGGGDNNRYPLGQVVEFNVISGHRDASFTLCPGKYLYPLLGQIRSEAATSMGRPGPLRSQRPARILDTRSGLGTPAGLVRSGQSRTFQVTGVGGVPASGVGTVVLNVTAIKPSQSGYLTVYPSGRPRPATPSLNYPAGRTTDNLVHIPVGELGKVSLYEWSADVHVVADVLGWTSNGGATLQPGEGLLNPTMPIRALDTRKTSALGPAAARSVKVTGIGGSAGVPATGAGAVVLNVHVLRPTTAGYLTVYPGGQSRPATWNLNFRTGETRANRVIVPVGTNGTVNVFNSAGSSHVIVDVNGWYTGPNSTVGGAKLTGITPFRLHDTRKSSLGALKAKETRTYQAAGNGTLPPADALNAPTAVVLNVTALRTTAPAGSLVAYQAGTTAPTAADLSYSGIQNVSNLVVVKLSAAGGFSLTNLGTDATNVLIDVDGFYTMAS
jgi:N-acetylmuramoyl-L-alanine amidase-like protein